jgi:hypothetical protein
MVWQGHPFQGGNGSKSCFSQNDRLEIPWLIIIFLNIPSVFLKEVQSFQGYIPCPDFCTCLFPGRNREAVLYFCMMGGFSE